MGGGGEDLPLPRVLKWETQIVPLKPGPRGSPPLPISPSVSCIPPVTIESLDASVLIKAPSQTPRPDMAKVDRHLPAAL